MVAVRLTQSSAMTVVGSFAYFSRREKPRCPRATGGARLHKFPTGERCHLWLGIRGAAWRWRHGAGVWDRRKATVDR